MNQRPSSCANARALSVSSCERHLGHVIAPLYCGSNRRGNIHELEFWKCQLTGMMVTKLQRLTNHALDFSRQLYQLADRILESAMSKAPRMSTRALLGPDQINEYASVVVLQIGQLVREVGEVVADASLQVLADVTIDRGQDAAAVLIDIREAKLSHLGQAVPLLEEPPIQPQHGELRGIVEETRLHPIQARLTQPVRVLAADGPVGCKVVGKIGRCDVALLKELGRDVLQPKLICGWDIIEVCVLDQGVQPVVPYRPVCVADHGLGVAAGIEIAERAIADRVIQFAEQAPAGRQLVFEVVTQKQHSLQGMCQAGLFHIVPAKLDGA